MSARITGRMYPLKILKELEQLGKADQDLYLEDELFSYKYEWDSLSSERKTALLESVAFELDHFSCWNYLYYGITPYLHFETFWPQQEESPVFFSDYRALECNYKTVTFGWETHALVNNCWRLKGSRHVYYCRPTKLEGCHQCKILPERGHALHLIKLQPIGKFLQTDSRSEIHAIYREDPTNEAYRLEIRRLDCADALGVTNICHDVKRLIVEYYIGIVVVN